MGWGTVYLLCMSSIIIVIVRSQFDSSTALASCFFLGGAPTSWLRGNATVATMARHLDYIVGWKVVDPRGVGQLDSTTARMDIQGAATTPSRFAAKEAAAAATVWRTTAPIAQTRACCEDSKTASSHAGGSSRACCEGSKTASCAGGGGSCAAQEAGAGGGTRSSSSDISAGAAAYQRLGRQNSSSQTTRGSTR